MLDGEAENLEADCGGRDVLIHGSRGHYRLRGGCRSVLVQGSANRIEAELQPGGRIGIGGDGVTLAYTLTRDGAPVQISVTGGRSEARPAQAPAPR